MIKIQSNEDSFFITLAIPKWDFNKKAHRLEAELVELRNVNKKLSYTIDSLEAQNRELLSKINQLAMSRRLIELNKGVEELSTYYCRELDNLTKEFNRFREAHGYQSYDYAKRFIEFEKKITQRILNNEPQSLR